MNVLPQIEFLKPQSCVVACTKTYVGGDKAGDAQLQLLKKGISLNYQHHWIVDNMPVTWCYLQNHDQQYCSTGFPMGCYVRPHEICIFNVSTAHSYSVPHIHNLNNTSLLYRLVVSIHFLGAGGLCRLEVTVGCLPQARRRPVKSGKH
uniref:Uncharacterized protein n=1 Tax=Timema douglasi TaxID=61478 RepID=A0A7R8VX01_TIMDO|nr:unnamed protein product [Timema douglasi]